MDNKITKKRLGNLLSYDWIAILATLFVCVILWELIYAFSSVKLTVGQGFYYYYDYGVNKSSDDAFKLHLQDTFSYDVLEWMGEGMPTEAIDQDVLDVRYAVDEVDVVFTNSLETKDEETGYGRSRAKKILDTYPVYDFNTLYADATDYLKQFLTDENSGNVLDYNDYSESKIKAYFHSRQKGDNRYRWKKIAEQDEIDRIKRLCKEVKDFKTILDYGNNAEKEDSIFYYYHKYEFSLAIATAEDQKLVFKELYDLEGGDKAFGIRLDKLPSSTEKSSTKDYFRLDGAMDSQSVVLTVFDMKEKQPDLQFETISFVNTVVRNFSTLLG